MRAKLRSYGHVLRDFSKWSSTHGIPHIGLATILWLRVFWTVVIFVCLGMFLYQMVELLRKYFEYKVNVDTKLEFGERVFPSVTLCHLNPYKLPKGNSSRLEHLVNEYNTGYPTTYGIEGPDKNSKAHKWTALLSEEMFRHYRMAVEMNDTSSTTDRTYRYQDIVLNCVYNTESCSEEDFETFLDPNYGVCFTFNANGKRVSSRAGPFYGLRVTFKTDQEHYLPWVEASGVVVTLHGENEVPFPNTNGYFAAPGEAASIGLRYSDSQRLEKPYGPCTNEEGGERTFYPTYNVETCVRSCIQRKIIDKCQCYDPSYHKPESATTNCLETKDPKKSMECIWEILNGDGSGGAVTDVSKGCNCPEPCVEETYGVTVSTALWPADRYTPPQCLAKTLAVEEPRERDPTDRRRKKMTPEECHQWFRENTAVVEVYYERMNYQMLTESAAYGLIPLVSDTGGNIGLWLGMSIISMIEWGVLLVLTGCYCCCMTPPKTEDDIERERLAEERKREKAEAKKARKQNPKNEAPKDANPSSDSLYAKENEAPLPPPVKEAF